MQTWLRLKPDLLPCISQEADKVAKDYQALIDRFRKGDREAIQDILMLQASIRARIDEFDKFYEQNYAEPKLPYFERTKMKLRKLLYTPIESPDQEQATEVRTKEPEFKKAGFTYEEQKESRASRADYSPNGQSSKISSFRQDKTKPSKSPVPKSKSPAPTRESISQKSQRPGTNQTSLNKAPSKEMISHKPQKSVGNQNGLVKKPEDAKKKSIAEGNNEVLFTIKMTKKEYIQYLESLKQKNGNK